ncbi:50S ribosomal protein L15 [Rosistilla carotiformis]|uniref:Large ribosomal subunit protein uL15 n=1 Tax=Rosistilla carotiformis TaxID=2528017 RepID=A0A518JZQ4_9BACT|nr:50S ribosomal protein L15 [Rosistilla carotiformis]QDV70955.1 50S ribosomal protein L15 [Rosistilla carotiformis]
MKLHDVNTGITKNRKRKRIGRGPGSGHGKTAGRGHKGHKSRSGYSRKPSFQGGTMPLFRRIPKRGFNNAFAPVVKVMNVQDLEALCDDGMEITPEVLTSTRVLTGIFDELKILGNGELTKKLKVSAHRFSKSAVEKIQAAGGEVTILSPKRLPKERAELLKSGEVPRAHK